MARPPRLSQSPDRPVLLILQIAILIRLINVSSIRTFFQPDEFFQSLEPAWLLTFGPQSGAWVTWEWHHQLRSSLHPAIFSVAYFAADLVSRALPTANAFKVAALLAAPRMLQALFAALGDWYTWQLATKIYGTDANVALFAVSHSRQPVIIAGTNAPLPQLFLQLISPWQWYCSTRTFSNSLEMTLTVMALNYWPWQLLGAAAATKENTKPVNSLRNIWELRASLCLAALAVVLRPTNLLIWVTILAVTLSRATLRGPSPLSSTVLWVLFREVLACGTLVLAISFISDYLYFGFWTFPPYNWLNFNISQSLAVFYGRNPWHYYLLQGLPLLSTTSLPFTLRSLYKPAATSVDQQNILRTLSLTVFTTILSLSLISHKEVRFIYPLLPILHVLAAPLAASYFTSTPANRSAGGPPRLRHKPYLFAALSVNIVLAGFLSFLHQPAPLSVMTYLRSEFERLHPDSVQLQLSLPRKESPFEENELFALFLMPCHSTPWRSHLVYSRLRAYALTCEPPLHTKPNTPERDNYRDEADRFYDDPIRFLSTELFGPGGLATPRYIVGFEGIEPWLRDFLDTPEGKATGMELRSTWSGFNGFFNEDWRRAGEMRVWDTGIYEKTPTYMP
ncbi:hypothetical protein S40288_02828 [Stachybotrys chartarum IBT 40288]|nr:hypothetical protein S40288_02828 [Stachybotrys chartarum IBT 40288]